jgi:hypothetical protein
MKRFNALVCGLMAVVIVGCGKQSPADPSPKGNPAAESAAIESAQAWLALVDGGSFGQSWDDAATVFKAAITQADWEKAVRAVRTPLGKLVSRKIKSQQYATSLPGAPDGKYVVIQYDTAFENKANAIETITPMLDKDGKWRVSGYYIK